MRILDGKTIAVLVTDGFEQVEMTEPLEALKEAGAKALIVSPQPEKIRGWNHKEWGDYFTVDVPLKAARPETFDCLLLPGGVMNPDTLRSNPSAVEFAKHFVDAKKPIAAICHGPQLLINAEGVRGRTITSYQSLKKDLENAGARWVDQEVVLDNNYVTSRRPSDIPVFNQNMIEQFAKAHPYSPAEQTAAANW